jgi:hypothetical protein
MVVTGQPDAPATLPSGKSSLYPLSRRLDGSQSQSELEKIIYLAPAGTGTPDHPTRSLVNYTDWAIFLQKSVEAFKFLLKRKK